MDYSVHSPQFVSLIYQQSGYWADPEFLALTPLCLVRASPPPIPIPQFFLSISQRWRECDRRAAVVREFKTEKV